MRHRHITQRMRVCLLAVLLITGGLLSTAYANRSTSGLAADHVIACIKTAVAAQAGLIKDVEVEDERGQWRCEVKLIDKAGTRHTLHVDVATNQVVKAR
jgi:acetylornithine deacetylase/succinyl-diaminopimelate desuccinylase-like protein